MRGVRGIRGMTPVSNGASTIFKDPRQNPARPPRAAFIGGHVEPPRWRVKAQAPAQMQGIPGVAGGRVREE